MSYPPSSCECDPPYINTHTPTPLHILTLHLHHHHTTLLIIMDHQQQQPHFILIPLMSQSHLIPFTDLARLIARRGPSVTIITTPLNAARFQPSVDLAVSSSNLKINLLPLPFPSRQPGLPENCENLDALPSLHLFEHFLAASRLLRPPLETLLKTLHPKPTCIVSDVVLPWTSPVARSLGIPRLVFQVISCFTLFCSHNLRLHNVCDGVRSDSEPFSVPEIPDKIEFVKPQLPGMMRRSWDSAAASQKFVEELMESETTADGMLVNTFQELEPNYVKGYGGIGKRNLWCVGPVSLSNREATDKAARGNVGDGTVARRCSRWLDSRPVGSVIYACFGSQSFLKTSQMIEIGLGLEASNRAFIWVIRKASNDSLSKLEQWMEEEGFEERVRGRGLIIKGWAPQVLILSHPAVGGFVTHCGWNSTLEAVSSGVPMATWPLGAEQFFNEKFIVHVLRTGVRVGVEKMCMEEGEGEESDDDDIVKRGEVKRAVDELMGEGEEAMGRRERAREMGLGAKRAIAEGGSSDANMEMMIQYIKDKSSSSSTSSTTSSSRHDDDEQL